MKICVIGIGYVGLTTATGLATIGHCVTAVDVDQVKIARLQQGIITFYDPDLTEYVQDNLSCGNLKFTTDIVNTVAANDICFIAVGTPARNDGSCDLSQVLSVAQSIAAAINNYKIIVIKSTVPPGTNQQITNLIKQHTKLPCDVVSNPEFLSEGKAMADFMHPDRIVIGTTSDHALNIIRKMYEPFEQQNVPLLVMDPISAELTKYAANCMLATRISFMNDLADLCEKIGGDIEYIRQGIGTDQRIGPDFLQAGLGYGGSCFPKDIQALIHVAQAHDHQLRVIPAAAQVNDYQQHSLFHKINNYFTGQLKDKKIAIWGLAFKPGTDDMRSSPAILLINRLLSAGAQVSVSDPQAINAARAIFSDKITYYPDHLDTIDNVDSLIIVTNWPQYQTPDFAFLKSQMRSPVIFDGRNLYSPDQMKNLGFEYFSVGRKAPFLL